MGYMIARVIAIALCCHQREGLIPTKVSILALIILNSYHFGSGWEWGGGIGVIGVKSMQYGLRHQDKTMRPAVAMLTTVYYISTFNCYS